MAAKALLALIVMTSAFSTAFSSHAVQAPEDGALAQVVATCDRSKASESTGETGGAEAQPMFPLGLLPGLAATPLGSLSAPTLPPGIEAELGFGRLSVAPQSDSEVRVAAGPLLFVVETGVLEVVINGVPSYWDANTSLLVERGHVYSFANSGTETTSVLVAGVEPPEGLIGAYGDQSVWRPLGREPETMVRERLAEAEVEHLRQEETLVFLACLSWVDTSTELESGRGYPGPVAMLALEGQVEVTTASVDRLGPGTCAVIPRYTPFRIAAGDQPATVLVVGLLPVTDLGVVATPEALPDDAVMTGSTTACAGWQPAGAATS